MREIDVGRGTENAAAKFTAIFGLSAKNHRGGPFGPRPIGAWVNSTGDRTQVLYQINDFLTWLSLLSFFRFGYRQELILNNDSCLAFVSSS